MFCFFKQKTANEIRISYWISYVCSSDLSSPWTCLAFHNLPAVLDGAGASARYRPILVGGVFNAVNPAVYAARAQADNRRMQHSWKVLADWARLAGVPMNFPSRWHPAKSVAAMRF